MCIFSVGTNDNKKLPNLLGAIKDWVLEVCDKICVTLQYNIFTSVHAVDLILMEE